MVAFEVVELHLSTLSDKNARAVDSKTFVGNALTAHRQNYSNAFRYFWFGDSHTLELTSLTMASMTAKMILQWTPRVRQCCDSYPQL